MPRSYDKTIPDGKTQPFKMTSNYCTEFNNPPENLTTKEGKNRVEKATQEFEVLITDS